jgi:hypothetical protein|uniref:Mitochondrial resolvase Ydc2 catalytic domain-containing protein n=1 Tax=viral metagenome TaxID=1070528 RepID=A0A6C0ECV1_9ZZZZ
MNENSKKCPLILSFDVGVVNLSYCLLTKNTFDNNKLNWDIIEWNNIDLTNRNNEKCHCGLKAFYTNTINNKIFYYCKKHSKNLNLNIESFEDCFDKCLNNKKSDNSYKCCHILKSKDNTKYCDKYAQYKQKNHLNSDSAIEPNIDNNKYYCTIHAKSYITNKTKLLDLKNFKIKNSSCLNFDDLKYKLIMELENRPSLLLANYVVIENQPSFKNPRMKSIASTIYDYYLIRGIIDKSRIKSNINQVKFMSPSNKLKLADNNDTNEIIKVKKTDNDAKTYKLTKSLGIKYCTDLIKHLSEWLSYFEKHKKKDDLADSFLQGVYFYNQK